MLVVGEDVKNSGRNRQRRRRKVSAIRRSKRGRRAPRPEDAGDAYREIVRSAQEDCHVVLHSDATNLDIVKSTIGESGGRARGGGEIRPART